MTEIAAQTRRQIIAEATARAAEIMSQAHEMAETVRNLAAHDANPRLRLREWYHAAYIERGSKRLLGILQEICEQAEIEPPNTTVPSTAAFGGWVTMAAPIT